MDAATLVMMISHLGSEPYEKRRAFDNVAQCEAHKRRVLREAPGDYVILKVECTTPLRLAPGKGLE